MGVDADLAVVVVLPVGAPDCLEVEHVEVHVDRVLLDELDRELRFAVRKRAVLLIVALSVFYGVKIRGAELRLVLIWVIEFLHSVMRFVAVVAKGAGVAPVDVDALLGLVVIPSATVSIRIISSDMFAHFRLVSAERPSAVLVVVMVERASLEIVVLGVLNAGVDLELVEVEEHDALTLGDIASIRSLDVRFARILLQIVLSRAEISLLLLAWIEVLIKGWIHHGLVHLLRRARHLLLHGREVGLLL